MAKMKRIMTIDEALRTSMPFGKYKSRWLVDITEFDMPYVEWVAANVKGRLGEAAKLIIEDIQYSKKYQLPRRRRK